MKRPIRDARPLGPFRPTLDLSQDKEQDSSNDNADVKDDNAKSSINRSNKLVQQAEKWQESVSDDATKIRMMRNYIDGVTKDSVSPSDIDEMLKDAGYDL